MITEVPRPRFLIDENLSPELAARARARGYEAMALRDLGLLTERDWDLLRVVERDDWTLVTNNVREFRSRYRTHASLHAGVVFLQGVSGLLAQMNAFEAALDDIDHSHDLINTEVLVECLGPENTRSLALLFPEPDDVPLLLSGGRLAARSGLIGAFFTGVLAMMGATQCTARSCGWQQALR